MTLEGTPLACGQVRPARDSPKSLQYDYEKGTMTQEVSPASYKWLRNSGLMLVAILPVIYLVKIQNINDDIIAFWETLT